jgi:hypothetical protein
MGSNRLHNEIWQQEFEDLPQRELREFDPAKDDGNNRVSSALAVILDDAGNPLTDMNVPEGTVGIKCRLRMVQNPQISPTFRFA